MKVLNSIPISDRIRALLLKQASAPIVAVVGPSSSTKSTTLAELLEKEAKKLLARNIGTKQTSLFDTLLMLNSEMDPGEVIIQCIVKSIDLVTFKTHLEMSLSDYLYKNRDELDDLQLDETVLKNILNPTNRAYHFYNYVESTHSTESQYVDCPSLQDLQNIITECYEVISPSLLDCVRQREKEAKTITPRPRKEKLFQLEVSHQFEHHPDLLDSYYAWFQKLYDHVLSQISFMSAQLDDTTFILTGNASDELLKGFMEAAYDKNSPYSIAVKQIAFLVRPSDKFSALYHKMYSAHNYENKSLRLNVLDTPGLTQVSEEKTEIQDSFDRILNMKFNALLFLCGSSRETTEYMLSREVLINNKKKLGDRPLLFVRTKADTVIDSFLREKARNETDSGKLENEFIEQNADQSYEFLLSEIELDDQIFAKENMPTVISGKHVEFLCLEPDRIEKINEKLSKKLDPEKLFSLLTELSLTIHDAYAPAIENGIKRCVRSLQADKAALQVNMNGYMGPVSNAFANLMVQQNEKFKDSYLQYTRTKFAFHGRSVSTYVRKHRTGTGHETNANVYENFRLFISNMISRWMNQFFNNWNTHFDIDFSNIDPIQGSGESVINEAPAALLQQFNRHKPLVIRSMAKAFSYDRFAEQFESCYLYNSSDTAFRENMNVFYTKFSNTQYWELGLKVLLKKELDDLLAKMYLYE